MNCHIVVSVCCTLHVKKSQGMEQLVYNYSVPYASVALEVQLLGLWVIENLWLTVSRQERHFVTTRSLIVAGISAEATASSQTWWSQQNMSIIPFICENQLCQNVQGEGQRPEWERNFGKIVVFGSYRRVEGDYWQEGNGGQRKQEGFASNIMHRTDFVDGQRSVEEECMTCLWTDKYVNKCVIRSHFNRGTTGGVTEIFFLVQSHYYLPTLNTLLDTQTHICWIKYQGPAFGLCRNQIFPGWVTADRTGRFVICSQG